MRLPICLLVLLMVSCAQARPLPARPVPADIKTAIDKAESVVLYSLEPEAGKAKPKAVFHGWPVLGKTELKGEAMKKLLVAFTKTIAEGRRGAKCFEPRHGVRIMVGGKAHDYLLCFQCHWMRETGGKMILISDKQAPVFNKVLADAKIPLAKVPTAK